MHAADFQSVAFVDRVLAACGGGTSIHLGQQLESLTRSFRSRAIDVSHLACDASALLTTLESIPSGSADLVAVYELFDELTMAERRRGFREMLRITRRAVLVRAGTGSRDAWEGEWLANGCRKHPLHQLVVPYQGLDWQHDITMLLERLPDDVSIGRSLAELAPMRDLHMDMLREAGRRADAHVARYMLARQFVRPRDRVLDAACGLGYGAAILADSTLADRVVGLDADSAAIRYASEHYARSRPRLSFDCRDLAELDGFDSASFDIIVSFETLEHLADPEGFVAACRRLLTPAGRLVCSVPNAWVDESGRDPNPHHLHVFDRQRLETLCRRHLMIEHVYGQTAGGGMKLPQAGRDLWNADERVRDAEWWLLVGMTPAIQQPEIPFRPSLNDGRVADRSNVLAYERDYAHPWLTKALVTVGLRTESKALLEHIANEVIDGVGCQRTPDRGAALCVKAYRRIEAGTPLEPDLVGDIDRYCAAESPVPHVLRWQISLRYAEGVSLLQQGSMSRAAAALEACALRDAIAFSPLLATKTVGAAFLLGWLAAQTRDKAEARRWWSLGIREAERALGLPWDALLISRHEPALFGLREATQIVEAASRCAAGLHLLPQIDERPGLVLSQLFETDADRTRVRELEREVAEARREIERLRTEAQATALLGSGQGMVPADLNVAVFGAGKGGERALATLRRRGVSVTCIADNDDSRHGSEIDGVPVVDPATLRRRGVDLVAVASLPGRAAIFAQLEGLGYRIGRDATFLGD
jgi:2-polyprenyl-3-methyl-5-hydroxy-6-metoxy-1,4-benzoquinol methylase